MARTAAPGGRVVVDASTTAADTVGYGMVSILMVATAASATIEVTDGDTDAVDTTPVTTLIDPDTGDAVDTSSFTLAASGDTKILAYIGEKRYVKAVGTNADVYVLLEEARKTTPISD